MKSIADDKILLPPSGPPNEGRPIESDQIYQLSYLIRPARSLGKALVTCKF